jgi:hypothetical protein
MNVDDVKWLSSHPVSSGTESPRELHKELPEAIFLTLAFLGSIGGTLGGVLISKLCLDNLLPISCSILGCAIGCFVLCAVGQFCAMLFHSRKIAGLGVGVSESTEKCVEEEVHKSGNRR